MGFYLALFSMCLQALDKIFALWFPLLCMSSCLVGLLLLCLIGNLIQAHQNHQTISHRIHGAGIYANMTGVFVDGIHVTIYSSTMDPSWVSKPDSSVTRLTR